MSSKKSSKTSGTGGTAVAALAAALIAAAAFGPNLLASHSWGNYHWERSANPVQLTLGDNFKTADWDSAYVTAVDDWNLSSVLELTMVSGGTNPKKCRPANGKIEVCADRYGNTGWLGLAGISVSGDHIIKAYAKMNDTYFNTPTYDTVEWRALVMCQEIGHAFGLGHQDEDFGNPNLGTCMDYTNDPTPNQHPNQHDYDQLEAMYAHLDSGGNEGGDEPSCPPNSNSPKCRNRQSPPPAFDMELPDVAQWGRLMATSSDGGQSIFMQDFGNGYRVYTHVTWTLDVAEGLRGGRR